MNTNNKSKNNKSKNINYKKPANPRYIPKSKYFKVGIKDTQRIKNIKEGMNHLFDIRNRELEEAFLQEATQYTERVLGESRKINFTEEEDHEAMDVIFNNSIDDLVGEGLSVEEAIDGEEEERLQKEAEEAEESDTLSSEEVWKLNEKIQQEDQEEYDRIRAEMEEEEAEVNKNN